jgi:hypothetical protein
MSRRLGVLLWAFGKSLLLEMLLEIIPKVGYKMSNSRFESTNANSIKSHLDGTCTKLLTCLEIF